MATDLAVSPQLALFKDKVAIPADLVQVRGDDHAYLRVAVPPEYTSGKDTIRVADLFSGCGGISLGVLEACHALGLGFQAALAADIDTASIETYNINFRPAYTLRAPLESVLQPLGRRASAEERHLIKAARRVDFLVAGPPCQGHSDLNNTTRRNDPKNGLYMLIARAAELLEPRWILIENVVGAVHDRSGVVQATRAALEDLAYETTTGIIDGTRIGIAQRRRRLLLMASRGTVVEVGQLVRHFPEMPRDLEWAIGDLEVTESEGILDEPSVPNADTRNRIDYLFKNELFDLPDHMRPPCHKEKPHSYKSIYGRLRWDQPAQTITSGFYSMCMGRYVHPSQSRTLTAHEAARLQFFPDFFDFSRVQGRTSLARLIGNAVPMKIAYIASLGMLMESSVVGGGSPA